MLYEVITGLARVGEVHRGEEEDVGGHGGDAGPAPTVRQGGTEGVEQEVAVVVRITSYNVCYTKLLRASRS